MTTPLRLAIRRRRKRRPNTRRRRFAPQRPRTSEQALLDAAEQLHVRAVHRDSMTMAWFVQLGIRDEDWPVVEYRVKREELARLTGRERVARSIDLAIVPELRLRQLALKMLCGELGEKVYDSATTIRTKQAL